MDYNNYSANQSVTLRQGQHQYVAIHSGGPGPVSDELVIPTSSVNIMNIHREQDRVTCLNVLSSRRGEKEGEMEEEKEEQDIDDILRNVMRVHGIQSVSPVLSEDESHPSTTHRRPLTEKQSQNAVLPSSATNRKPPIYAHLPQGFCYKFTADGDDSIAGVITGRTIGKGQLFGPYNGSLLTEEVGAVIGSTWELCLRGAVCFYLDGQNKIHNNWLHHISPARTREEQNLEAFQHYGDIYFRALDTIQPGTELRVFYSDEYRLKIGCRMGLDELNYQKDTDDFQCKECKARYKTSKSMLRHIKFSHDQEEGPAKLQLQPDTAFSQFAKTGVTASDQLAELTKHVRRDNTSRKVACHESSERAISRDRIDKVKKGGMGPNSWAHAKAPPGSVQPSESMHRAQVLPKRTSNVSRYGAVVKPDKKRLAWPGGEATIPESEAPIPESGEYICPTCGKSFSNEGKLALHQLFHRTTMTEFNCEICGHLFKTYQECIRHRNSHAENLYTCFLCKNKYRYPANHLRHLQNVHHIRSRQKKLICLLCNVHVGGKRDMIAHRAFCRSGKKNGEEWERDEAGAEEGSKALRSGERGSSDTYEDNSFSEELRMNAPDQLRDEKSGGWIDEEEDSASVDKISVNNSSGNEDNNEDFLSDSQQQNSSGRLRLNQKESDHLGRPYGYYDTPRPFKCKSCGRRFKHRSNLSGHMKQVHSLQKPKPKLVDSRPFKCEQCPRTFGSKQAWNNHQVDHTGVKRFKCEPCFKWFSTSKRLYVHNVRIHRNPVKKHECQICGKKFLIATELRIHEERHRGERKFACEICGKTFTSKHALQYHMERHTTKKPFACEVCGKQFALELYLLRHTASHKSEETQSENADNNE